MSKTGCVVVQVTEFSCRVSSRAAAVGVDIPAPRLQSLRDATLAAARADGATSVAVLMGARARVRAEAGAGASVDVVFHNVENGAVEAVIVPATGACVTGLEGSAAGGEGFGIEAFQNPNRGDDVKIGLTSRLPSATVERLARQASITPALESATASSSDGAGGGAETAGRLAAGGAVAAAVAAAQGRSSWRPWTWRERAATQDEDPEPQPLKDILAETLTGTYGKLQLQAGEAVGLDGGAAWRVRPPILAALQRQAISDCPGCTAMHV